MLEQYNNIPALLKHWPHWVVWGVRDAPLKAPYNPVSLLSGKPAPAKAGVIETWGSYDAAAECVARGLARGIGYEFHNGGIYGVDLDHVIRDGGQLTPEAREVVSALDSYTEVSPSGSGLHIFVIGKGANIARHRRKDYFLEIYSEARYFTVTGDVYGGAKPIEKRSAALQGIHDKFMLQGETERRAGGGLIVLPSAAMPSGVNGGGAGGGIDAASESLRTGLARDKVFKALWSGERRNHNESADDQALMNKLAYWCNADPDAMARAFLSSPYFQQKDDAHKKKCTRADYLPKAAQNACNTAYSTAMADSAKWLRDHGHTNERGRRS